MWNFHYPLPYGMQCPHRALAVPGRDAPRPRDPTPPLPDCLRASKHWEEHSCRVESSHTPWQRHGGPDAP